MKRRHILLALGWYHPKIHQGIAKFAGEHNWHLASEMAFDQNLAWDWQGDGIIASLVAGRNYEAFIDNNPAPTVIIGNSTRGLNCVLIHEDNQAIAHLAAEYFMERGFRNYAFIWTKPHFRGQLFTQKLNENGYICTSLVPPKVDNRCSSLFEWLSNQLISLPKPVAIFCPDDNSGAEVIEACLDCGIAVPEEVAVLGVHNDELVCKNLPVTLSSIDNDFERQGYEAATILQSLMDGEEVPPHVIQIPPKKVVERLSTDVLSYNNVEFCKALRFIKNSFARYINVSDVVAATSVSRRTLYNAFNKYLGRSIAEEILRYRMESATNMLAETDMPVIEIAAAVGFNDYRIFHRNFRRKFSSTPTEWRHKNKKSSQDTNPDC